MGMRENIAKYDDKKLTSNYRLHVTFAVVFTVVLVLVVAATQSLGIDGLLWVLIAGGNGYAAHVTKQEIERRR